jgi:hypothetical protein
MPLYACLLECLQYRNRPCVPAHILPSPSFVWYNERIGCEDFSFVSFKYCMCVRVQHGHMDKCAEEKGRKFPGVNIFILV